MDYYFKTEKLSVGYQKKPVVEEVGIGIRKGEILTLIGPNGAGKSTVLKSIAGQLAPLAGTVYIDGKDKSSLDEKELSRRLSVVWTQKLRAERMTCEDVVATGRYPYTGRFGMLTKEDHDKIEEAMELVHVSDLKDCDFTCVSDGQRQQVMLARAICQEPEILILDEPTSYLDVRHKLEILSFLQEMQREKNLTVIMSLHELDLAAKVSDKLLCLNGRYAQRFGTPEDIFERGYLSELFGIQTGSYEEESGCMELEKAKGEASVFVIAGMGKGRNVYRRLQRQGVPFVTGILYDNDQDYPVARALGTEVYVQRGLEPVSEELLAKAKKALDICDIVISCRRKFGSLEQANRELLEYARARGKVIERCYGDKK